MEDCEQFNVCSYTEIWSVVINQESTHLLKIG